MSEINEGDQVKLKQPIADEDIKGILVFKGIALTTVFIVKGVFGFARWLIIEIPSKGIQLFVRPEAIEKVEKIEE